MWWPSDKASPITRNDVRVLFGDAEMAPYLPDISNNQVSSIRSQFGQQSFLTRRNLWEYGGGRAGGERSDVLCSSGSYNHLRPAPRVITDLSLPPRNPFHSSASRSKSSSLRSEAHCDVLWSVCHRQALRSGHRCQPEGLPVATSAHLSPPIRSIQQITNPSPRVATAHVLPLTDPHRAATRGNHAFA